MKTFTINAAVISLAACTLCVRAVSQQGLGPPTKNSGAIEISFSEMVQHFVSGSRVIHYSGPSERIPLRIVVTPEGNVQSATPEAEKPKWRDQAVSQAKTWRYIPFQRNGKPVLATFSEDVNIVPPEHRPQSHSPQPSFPEIRDWNSLKITLHRTRCYGTCPSYSLAISGDGSVVYRGDAFVRYCGDLRGQVSTRVSRQLVQMFSAADYFNLFDRYAMSATDLPTYTTSISFDEKSKSVIDYDGLWVGMPEAVMDIEDSVDRLAGPRVWAKETDANGDLHHPCRR